MTKSIEELGPKAGRRDFLKSAAAGAASGAAVLVGTGAPAARAQQPVPPAPADEGAEIAVPAPTEAQLAREEGDVRPPQVVRAAMAPGSDLMVDVLRDLGVEYVSSNPGSSFEGLQESIINHGNPRIETLNSSPHSTKCRRWTWPTATPRPRASPWWR